MSAVEVEFLCGLGLGGGESCAPADPPVFGSLEDLELDLDSVVDMECEDALIVSNLFLFYAILPNLWFFYLNLLFM